MKIWDYFYNNITDHMKQIKSRGSPSPTYSWIELILESLGIFFLCIAPKSIYVVASLSTLFISMPIYIVMGFLLILRMPSNKAIGSSKAKFWYKDIAIEKRRIF